MLISNPDLINSCRVCRSPNQDGEYDCLYVNSGKHEETPMLSEAGILYENMLDISLNITDYYPQFLCNSCELQMKLFKKLKDKAFKTLEYLQSLYENDKVSAKQEAEEICENNYLAKLDAYEEYVDNTASGSVENTDYIENMSYECQTNETNDYAGNADNEYEMNAADENLEQQIISARENFTNTLEPTIACTTQPTAINIDTLTNEIKIEMEPTIPKLEFQYSTELQPENTANCEENVPQISLDLEPILDTNDYVTEIYELLEDENNDKTFSQDNENIEVYDVYTDERTVSSPALSDVDLIIEEEMYDMQEQQNEMYYSNMSKKRRLSSSKRINAESMAKKDKYRCEFCQLQFQNIQEQKAHRTEVHDDKYPCKVCTSELKSLQSLNQHMKLHRAVPAFQCEICPKTFNQKAHLNYHMNNHNNVRNFKCSECEKACISSNDLKVHMRSHTGQRPYVCNICGKDYLMAEHLKTHLITHTGQVFYCNICNHKFATPKSLRMHVRTIHEDEPRFKCSFCAKPFRRKHHLEYHLRLHKKDAFLDSPADMVDDPDTIFNVVTDHNNINEFVDSDFIDDPGFIALSDNGDI